MRFRFRDFALIAALLIAGAAAYALMQPKDAAQTAKVYMEDALVWVRDLSQDGEFTVNGVTIEIISGSARVRESTCKNGACVKSGYINKAGQSVVCLPNKVSLVLEGGGMDAVLR